MTVQTRAVRTVDLPLGRGRQTLRLILHLSEDGVPEALSLAVGYGGLDGTAFLRPAWADRLLSIPAGVIPDLRDALSSLLEEVEP